MKKNGIFVIIIAFVIFTMAGAGVLAVKHNRNAYVLMIDDIPVYREEFSLAVSENIAKTYMYFKQKYNAEDSDTFWDEVHDGITPLQYVKELAVSDLVRKKAKLSLMLENGIVSDISYSAFKNQLKQENERRKAAVAKGEPVYGPVEYGETEFDIYLMSNREISLKNKLVDSVLLCSEEDMRKYYEENKDAKYKIKDTITLLVNGEEIVFSHPLQRHNSETYPEIYNAAQEMAVGEIREVTLEDGQRVTVKCVKREHLGYMEFDEVKDAIKQDIIDGQYEKIIDERAGKTKVTINHKVYDKIKVR